MAPRSKLSQLAHRVVHQAMEPSKARNDANVRPNDRTEAGALASRSRSRRPVACGETRGTPAPIRARGNRSADGFRLRDRRPALRIRSRARATATPGASAPRCARFRGIVSHNPQDHRRKRVAIPRTSENSKKGKCHEDRAGRISHAPPEIASRSRRARRCCRATCR